MASLLAIDVGKKNLHMVQGSFSKTNVVIDKAASFPVPRGVFNGEIIDNPDQLAAEISRAISIAGFTTKDVVVTFDGYGSVIREIDLPPAKPKEIGAMIATEMIETYHVEADDFIQYKVIEERKSLNRYRATAVNREIIESYHSVLLVARLKPVAMDININTIDKLLAGEVLINDRLTGESGIMIIDFGDMLTTIYIISKGRPMFFRQLDTGSSEIEKIVSESTFEAEEDIRKMKEEGYNFFGDSEEEEKYANILRPFFYSMTDEIRKVIGFYTSRSSTGSISQIYLCGGGSKLTGLAGYCENNFNVPTEQILRISGIKLKDTAIPVASYMNAIGALIRY